MNPIAPNPDLDSRYRALLVMWISLMMNVVVLFVVGQIVGGKVDPNVSNKTLSFALAALGTFSAVISFAVKAKLLRQAIAENW